MRAVCCKYLRPPVGYQMMTTTMTMTRIGQIMVVALVQGQRCSVRVAVVMVVEVVVLVLVVGQAWEVR